MQNLKNIISSSLKETLKEFSKNELAFLALTTKIEFPLRDRWAYILFNKLSKKGFLVSREWKRTDIAIIREDRPIALVEIKALYTFDALDTIKKTEEYYKKQIRDLQHDEEKASKLALKLKYNDVDIYTVLFVTHPLSGVENKLEHKGIVKYDSGINRAFKKYKNAGNIKKIAKAKIREEIKGKNLITEGVLKAGSAFNIETEIIYWILCK